ncbi:MAG: glycerol kinase, partial [Acidobacteriales bacterium]
LMQFQADILGVPVVRSEVQETTALGAAYLAGLATGFWKSQREISSHWREGGRFNPSMPASTVESLRGRWKAAVERAKAWEQSG